MTGLLNLNRRNYNLAEKHDVFVCLGLGIIHRDSI